MPKAVKGVLVECDPSIKAIILKIDQSAHDYIVEDLDDQTLVIKESQLPKLKARLEEVSVYLSICLSIVNSSKSPRQRQRGRKGKGEKGQEEQKGRLIIKS